MERKSAIKGAFTILPQERVVFGAGCMTQLAAEIDR